MGRVKMYDANEIARSIRETFTAKKEMREREYEFVWPARMQCVGHSLAVAYESDKWQDDKKMVLYKHLAEDPKDAPNFAYCTPGFLRDFGDPEEPWPTIGPMVSLKDVPMPRHFAILARFKELNLRLYTRGTDKRPQFGKEEDDGVVKVTVKHAMLGASKILWSQVSDQEDQLFLFVFSPKEDRDGGVKAGVHVIITGDELDVHPEGIVG